MSRKEQREDAHRSKLALAFIATDALQVIRLFAIDEAKQRGELDNIRIDQHTSSPPKRKSRSRATLDR